tara:strand:- start:333 stop:575 length:243 start_codon:yes stop_codon:yes gene_type:complete
MGTESTRRYKVAWIEEKLGIFFAANPKGAVSKKKLVSAFALETASTQRTGLEIVALLNDSDIINVEGDDITRGVKQNDKI